MSSYCKLHRCAASALFVLHSIILTPVIVFGQSEKPAESIPVKIERLSGEIIIDGSIDESAWNNATPFEIRYEVDPGENRPASVKTVLFLGHDDHQLYAAFRCYDPDPSRIRAFYSKRDEFDGDWVCLNFDTFNDERRSLSFSVNPLGVQWDAIRSDSSANLNWDSIWDSAGRITEFGYEVEIAIPFSSLSFQRGEGAQIWGLDAWRYYPRDLSYTFALVARDYQNSNYHGQLLKIIGFEGVTSGNDIEINPTLTTTRTDAREDFPTGEFAEQLSEAEAGITSSWGITPNFNLGITVNPDFSQVEADALELEINRQFAIYYPEKRPFFTENSDYFNACLDVVHTRNMVSPEWGLKFSGREGENTFGAYYVKDEVTSLIFPGTEYSRSMMLNESNISSVLRYKRDFGSNNNNVGLIYTGREGESYHNRLVGVDSDLRLTSSDILCLEAFHSATEYSENISDAFDQPVGEFQDSAFVLEYYHEQRNVNWVVKYWNVGKDFRTDLGELPIVGFEYYTGMVNLVKYADQPQWWSSITVGGGVEYYNDSERELLNRLAGVWFALKGNLQSTIRFQGNFNLRERYNTEYFDKTSYTFSVNFRPANNVGVSFYSFIGDQIDYANTRLGSNIQTETQIDTEIGHRFTLSIRHLLDRMVVNDEHLYTANSADIWLRYHFSRKVYARLVLQYLDLERNTDNYLFAVEPEYRKLFTQLLFSCVINPRTVLYIGYSGNHFGADSYPLSRRDRTVFMKLGYSWNL